MLTVSVISPEKILFEGPASSVVAPGHDGELGLLPGHAPLMTVLGRGVLRLEGGSAGTQCFQVDGGFLQIVDNTVRVVTESATVI
jgi:F-type H+-transporting ATPase subunit epsilon